MTEFQKTLAGLSRCQNRPPPNSQREMFAQLMAFLLYTVGLGLQILNGLELPVISLNYQTLHFL